MTGNISWIFIIAIGVCIGVYYLFRQGKIPWLKGIKMPRMFDPKPTDLTEKLKAQTKKEVAKGEELKTVLEAKINLAKAKAENIRLRKDIDGVSEKSVEREKQLAEEEAQKAKPGRLYSQKSTK